MSQNWSMLLVMFVLQIIASLANYSFSGLSSMIKTGLSLSDTQLGMIPGVIFTTGAISTVLWGHWVDFSGARRLALIGPTVLGLALVAASFSDGFSALLLAVAIWGIGNGSIMPITNKAVAGWFPGGRGLAIGLKQSGVTLGASLAAFILPWAALSWTWKGALLGTGVLTVVVGLATYAWYRDAASAVSEPVGGQASTGCPPARAQIPPAFRPAPGLATVGALGFIFSAYQTIWNTFLIPILESGGTSVVAAGALLGCAQITGATARLVLGAWSDVARVSRQTFLGVSGVVGGTAGLVFALSTQPPLALSYALMCLVGLGAMSWAGLVLCMATEAREDAHVGYASGVVTSSTLVGAALGPLLFGWAADFTASYDLPLVVSSTAMALLGLVIGFRGWRRRVVVTVPSSAVPSHTATSHTP